jgi:hypothetical protein
VVPIRTIHIAQEVSGGLSAFTDGPSLAHGRSASDHGWSEASIRTVRPG